MSAQQMEKLFIENRKNQKVCVLMERSEPQHGLAFVMHGLSGYKEEMHIAAIAEAFKEKKYTVVRFDTTHTLGESEGGYEDATATNYYEDLEDVIVWAGKQKWYQEPFCLAGHSLGGLAVALFAQRYTAKVKCLAPISAVVSGRLSMQVPGYNTKTLEEWLKVGWITKNDANPRAPIRKLKATHLQDRLKYDLLAQATKLTMPILMIVGDRDSSTPIKHQQLLYDALPGRKELHVIKGASHTPRERSHLKELKNIFLAWIDTL